MTPRSKYLVAVAAAIGLGLASRAATPWKDPGDALYATMMVFLVAASAPRLRPWIAAAVALACCVAIECSQLYRGAWVDAIRRTLPGRLVLGQGFHAFDLVDYAIGTALGAGVRWLLDGCGRVARPHDGG